jgi:hypothetical protein
MLRMQEMTFPGFKNFLGEYSPRRPPPFMCGILATHVAFSHCYPPLIYYLTERSLFKKCPPTGKSLKKALMVSKIYIFIMYFILNYSVPTRLGKAVYSPRTNAQILVLVWKQITKNMEQ